MTKGGDAGEVLEPEPAGDADDGEDGGDDDKILVSSALTTRRQNLVLLAASKCAHVQAVQGEVVRVIHRPHCVIFRGKMVHPGYLPPQLVDGADVRHSPHAAPGQAQHLHVLLLCQARGGSNAGFSLKARVPLLQ